MTDDSIVRVATVAAAIAALPEPLLFATDVDGTLSTFVDDPEMARLLPDALDQLWFIALSGRRVAVISGRPLDDLVGLFGLPSEFVLIGSHGAEYERRAELTPDEQDRLLSVKRIFHAVLESAPGAHIEHKPVSTSFHVRRVDPALAEIALARVRLLLAAVPGVTVHEGHCVIEVAVRTAHKAAAMATLLDHEQPASVVFVGDDAADERVFAALTDQDRPFVTVKVGDGPTVAGWRLVDPTEVVALLRAVAAS